MEMGALDKAIGVLQIQPLATATSILVIPPAPRMRGRIRRSCTESFLPISKVRPIRGGPIAPLVGFCTRVFITDPEQRDDRNME